MAQGKLEFLFGPWQKDRRRQDNRQHHPRHQDANTQQQQQQHSSRNRGPEARAQRHGPRHDARRSSRPKTRRAAHRRMCTAQLTPLKSRRGALTSAAQLWRVSAPYWPKIARRKTKNFFHWIKTTFRTFRFAKREFLMRTAVFIYENVCAYSFSLCVCLDVSGGHA